MRCSREVGMSALNISLVKPPSGGLKMRSFHMMSMNTAPTAIRIQERTQGVGEDREGLLVHDGCEGEKRGGPTLRVTRPVRMDDRGFRRARGGRDGASPRGRAGRCRSRSTPRAMVTAGDSRVDRYERVCARTEHGVEEIPAEDVRRDSERLARVLGFASAALTAALATTPRLTAGTRDARIAPAEKPAERPTAPVERNEAPPSLGAGAVEVPPTAQHRGLASAGEHEDLVDAVLARGTARRAETAPTAAMITVPTSVVALRASVCARPSTVVQR